MFPNLWRFGIKFSETSDISIKSKGEIITPKSSSLLALYPQIKGIPDTGIQEYTFDNSNIFNQISLGGKIQPMQYAKESIHKAIKLFFENGVPAKYLPDIVLQEKLWNFIEKTNRLFDNKAINKITTEEIKLRFHFILKYIGTIFFSNDLSKSEIQFKNIIFNQLINTKNYLDITSIISFGCTESFKEFYKKEKNNPFPIHKIIFQILNRESIEIICIINELKKRCISEITPVWRYDGYALRQMEKEQFLTHINEITSKWLNNLPDIYFETYSKLFATSKYQYNNKIIYRNYNDELNYGIQRFSTLVYKYPNNTFSILYDENLNKEFTDNGLSNIISGYSLDTFIDNKLLYSQSLNCILYNGICEELGFKRESLNIGSSKISVGLYLF